MSLTDIVVGVWLIAIMWWPKPAGTTIGYFIGAVRTAMIAPAKEATDGE